MKLCVGRFSLIVTPETATDEAWLEEVLGLKHAGDSVPLRRVNAMGLSCWAYAEAKAERERAAGTAPTPTHPLVDFERQESN